MGPGSRSAFALRATANKRLAGTTSEYSFGSVSRFPEHPPENRIDVLEVIGEVELLLDLGVGEIFLHIRVLFQKRLEVAFAAPHRHRVALHELVGVLAARALLRQRDQEPLRMNEAAEAVEIFLH